MGDPKPESNTRVKPTARQHAVTQGSAHLRMVFYQPNASAAEPYVTACCLAVGFIHVQTSPPASAILGETLNDEDLKKQEV